MADDVPVPLVQADTPRARAIEFDVLLRRLVRFGLLAGFLWGLRYLSIAGLRVPTSAVIDSQSLDHIYLAVLVAGAGAVVLSGQWLRAWLAVISAAAFVYFLREWGLVGLGYVAAIVLIGRLPTKLRYQLLLAVAVWAIIPMWKWQWRADFPVNARSWVLGIFWAQMAYASVYVLVERARSRRRKPTAVDEACYLTLLPRLAEPFFQPISPKYLYETAAPLARWGALARASGLGVFGIALFLAFNELNYLGFEFEMAEPLLTAHKIITFYCIFAGQVFVAMAMIRFLGFDVASGMKQPFLSRSFRDFFRRWNHYIRDAVISLFLFPLQGYLRERFSPRVATVLSAYGAIIIGSLLLNDILVPTVTDMNMGRGFASRTSPAQLLMHLLYWSAIILPRTGLDVTAQKATAGWPRRILEILTFYALYGSVWYAIAWLRDYLG